jgi:hypothetical protein
MDLTREFRILCSCHSIAFETEAVLGIRDTLDLVSGKFDEKIRETPIVEHPKL